MYQLDNYKAIVQQPTDETVGLTIINQTTFETFVCDIHKLQRINLSTISAAFNKSSSFISFSFQQLPKSLVAIFRVKIQYLAQVQEVIQLKMVEGKTVEMSKIKATISELEQQIQNFELETKVEENNILGNNQLSNNFKIQRGQYLIEISGYITGSYYDDYDENYEDETSSTTSFEIVLHLSSQNDKIQDTNFKGMYNKSSGYESPFYYNKKIKVLSESTLQYELKSPYISNLMNSILTINKIGK